MRIMFTGAQGTGKSTLVYKLKKIYPELDVIDSMSSLFLNSENKEIQTSIDEDGYIDFQNKITFYHMNNMVNKDNYICSRAIADSYAFLTYAYWYSKNKKVINYCGSFREVILNTDTPEDTMIFYLPIKFKISQEGNSNRATSREYQEEIDTLIQEYFKVKPFKNFHEVKSNSIEGRVKEIRRIIDEY